VILRSAVKACDNESPIGKGSNSVSQKKLSAKTGVSVLLRSFEVGLVDGSYHFFKVDIVDAGGAT
jgi:hypothetical protein